MSATSQAQNGHAAIETRLFINNEYVDAQSSERFDCRSPVDDAIVAQDVHVAGQEDINRAVAAARKAFPAYSALHPSERARMLLKLADVVEENADELGRLEALCTGKPLTALKGYEIPMIAGIFRYYAGWCDKLAGESFPADGGFIKIVKHEPLGVCAAINAFNGPTTMIAFKAAPCLAAGNTMVMKASEKTPLSTNFFGNLVKQAGFAPGVLNFLSGAGATGAALASHMDVNKISFTGSVGTGKKISAAASQSNLKRVTLELGGKSPSIIFSDANLNIATTWCTQGITSNAGQACIASSRVYVHEDIKEEFVARMKTEFERLSKDFGDPFAASTTNAPLVDKMQFDKVSAYIEAGKKSGTLVTGGEPLFPTGCWIKPTIFVDTEKTASVYTEEIFGPVLVVNSFTDEDDVITRANASEFGLSSAVFTQDINRAHRVASRLYSGTVGINCCTIVDYTVPFGGFKQSGQGRELGKYGIMAYTEPKTIFINMTY